MFNVTFQSITLFFNGDITYLFKYISKKGRAFPWKEAHSVTSRWQHLVTTRGQPFVPKVTLNTKINGSWAKRGGNHIPTVAVGWHHIFSVTSQGHSFLSSFLVQYEKRPIYTKFGLTG